MNFTCCHYFQADNKQHYNHAIKLSDDRFRQIRLFTFSEVSGSVPRPGNKQSVLLGW
nr:hypothetical protein LV142 [Klebsiella pneumoniae CG43]QGF03513.1 hypothetical protein pVir-SCNJ1-268 [Klebsiella pneumoniae subsp. pneumoniae]QIK04064.1 hypothetical protein [Klebsiella pneumoniae]UNJ80456.1 hypothetical protein [Escherichia coli]QIQ14864.1 hypothetical protein [Klebsiella pneumoniae]